MTYSNDREESILDEFDNYFESVASNINNDSDEQDIAESNEMVQQFLDELQEEIDKSKT